MSRPVDIAEIVGMLAARAPELCATLFPQGRREGHEFRIGDLDGNPGRSLAVHLTGARAGVWSDFASGEAGDALDLVAQARFPGSSPGTGDKAAALRWARQWLGLDGVDPAALRRTRRAVETRAAEEPTEDDARIRASAFRLWLSASERLAGTPIDRYLAGRGIDLRQLGRCPRALRYHAGLWNRESDRRWPAMVAAITDAAGATIAVHRTWLQVHGEVPGSNPEMVTKAPLRDAKMTLGRYRGGAIRLWRGASMKPLREAPAGETVVLAEGIEDGLTAAIAAPEHRVMAAVSIANMGNIVLPPAVARVIILAQNDKDAQAIRGLDRAVRHFLGQGKRVLLARPPEVVKDVNDLVRAGVSVQRAG